MNERIELTITYPAGHSYAKVFERSDVYCLHCGKQEVWRQDDGGDYYAGETHVCTACKGGFTFQENSANPVVAIALALSTGIDVVNHDALDSNGAYTVRHAVEEPA